MAKQHQPREIVVMDLSQKLFKNMKEQVVLGDAEENIRIFLKKTQD